MYTYSGWKLLFGTHDSVYFAQNHPNVLLMAGRAPDRFAIPSIVAAITWSYPDYSMPARLWPVGAWYLVHSWFACSASSQHPQCRLSIPLAQAAHGILNTITQSMFRSIQINWAAHCLSVLIFHFLATPIRNSIFLQMVLSLSAPEPEVVPHPKQSQQPRTPIILLP